MLESGVLTERIAIRPHKTKPMAESSMASIIAILFRKLGYEDCITVSIVILLVFVSIIMASVTNLNNPQLCKVIIVMYRRSDCFSEKICRCYFHEFDELESIL